MTGRDGSSAEADPEGSNAGPARWVAGRSTGCKPWRLGVRDRRVAGCIVAAGWLAAARSAGKAAPAAAQQRAFLQLLLPPHTGQQCVAGAVQQLRGWQPAPPQARLLHQSPGSGARPKALGPQPAALRTGQLPLGNAQTPPERAVLKSAAVSWHGLQGISADAAGAASMVSQEQEGNTNSRSQPTCRQPAASPGGQLAASLAQHSSCRRGSASPGAALVQLAPQPPLVPLPKQLSAVLSPTWGLSAPPASCLAGGKIPLFSWAAQLISIPSACLAQGKIKSLEQIYLFSLAVKEYQIVDFFLGSALKDEARGGRGAGRGGVVTRSPPSRTRRRAGAGAGAGGRYRVTALKDEASGGSCGVWNPPGLCSALWACLWAPPSKTRGAGARGRGPPPAPRRRACTSCCHLHAPHARCPLEQPLKHPPTPYPLGLASRS